MGERAVRMVIKLTAGALTAVLVLGGCATASAPRAEDAVTVRPAQIFSD
jgi:hypothetical protein